MPKHNRKEIFSVLGEIGETEVTTDRGTYKRHTFIPASQPYMRDRLNKIPLKKKVSVTFFDDIPTRSQQQLAYHFVLLTLISEHTGDSVKDLHDGIMRIKFGTKKIKIMEKEVEVRKSIANDANMPKHKAQELIDFDLEVCKFLELRVPTKSELGYVDENEKVEKAGLPEYPKESLSPKFD